MTEAEIRKCVGMDQEAIAVVEDGFTRLADGEVTICDLTGVGVQDTVIAFLAYRKGVEKGLGLQIEV